MFNRHQTVGEGEICSYMLQMASLLFAPPRSRSSCILSDYYHIFVFVQLNQIDEDLGVFLHQLLLHQLLLHQLLLHNNKVLILMSMILLNTLFDNKEVMDLSDFYKATSPYVVTRHIEGTRNVKYYQCCSEPYIDLNFR